MTALSILKGYIPQALLAMSVRGNNKDNTRFVTNRAITKILLN